MNWYTSLLLSVLITHSYAFSCSHEKLQSLEDPYDRTPQRVQPRLQSDGKEIMRPFIANLFLNHARQGKCEDLERLFKEHGTVDTAYKGFTAIYEAVEANQLATVRWLINHNAHVTRLYMRKKSIRRTLATETPAEGSHGASLETEKHSSEEKPVESLLDVAIRKGHGEMALLLAQFIPLWLPNGEGQLPLCNALRADKTDIARALILSNPSNIEHLLAYENCKSGEYALGCAKRLGHADIAELIVQLLANHKPKDSNTAIQEGRPRNTSLTSSLVIGSGVCLGLIGLALVGRTKIINVIMKEMSNASFLPYSMDDY